MAEQKNGPNQSGKLAQSKRVASDGDTQEDRAESNPDKTSSATLVRDTIEKDNKNKLQRKN